ncbi:ATP-binding protein [Rhodovibrionaceae bacterium A322]
MISEPWQIWFLIALGVAASTPAILLLVLHRRAARMRSLYEAMEAISRPRQISNVKGQVLFANDACQNILAAQDRPLVDALSDRLIDEEVKDNFTRFISKAYQGQSGEMELPVPSTGMDGQPETRWYYVAGFAILSRPGEVFWRLDDITSRRQMEETIQQEQRRITDLMEQAPIGFYSVDQQGRFLLANKRFADWLGRSPENLTSGDLRLHDLLAQAPTASLEAHLMMDVGSDLTSVTLKRQDGGEFDARIIQDVIQEADGGMHTRSVVRNLEEERAAEDALALSERRFRRVFDESPIGILQLDRQGVITVCNEAASELWSCQADDLVGKPLASLFRPEDKALLEQAIADSQPTGGGSTVAAAADTEQEDAPQSERPLVELHLAAPSEVTCQASLQSFGDDDKPESGFIAHLLNTTEQKALEAQFVQSQKMQAVGQLAGGIAHDFNNLLTAMIGFSDLLLLRHRPGDQSFADIMQIKQNANRAANLVRQLLAFSRQQTLQPKVLNVTDILAELSHLLRRLIGETIELKVVHGRGLSSIKADQGQLEQVIINLAVNARDAMKSGGRLEIRTSNVTTTKVRRHKTEIMPAGSYVQLQVVDTGHGIPEEIIDRIFDPFFSTKGIGEGTGLGLSTVYGIVKQTGGFIFVESSKGRGTTFSIYLPENQASSGAATDSDAPQKLDLTGAGTIMLVEDEEPVRAFSARALRNKGYTVLEAPSGEAALELLQKDDEAVQVDLLVTDVVMPNIDGPELVERVAKLYPDLKVIFISGYAEDSFRRRVGEDREVHFLPKPFSLKQLAGKVKEVLLSADD